MKQETSLSGKLPSFRLSVLWPNPAVGHSAALALLSSAEWMYQGIGRWGGKVSAALPQLGTQLGEGPGGSVEAVLPGRGPAWKGSVFSPRAQWEGGCLS